MFSNSRAVNVLSAARLFLFGSRDVWFVVGLPVFLRRELGWSFWQVGAFLAVWVIGYGVVQAVSAAARRRADGRAQPDGRSATWLAFVLAGVPGGDRARRSRPMSTRRSSCSRPGRVRRRSSRSTRRCTPTSSSPTPTSDKVAMNVGFYYMANAGGRLAGTVLSGALYQWRGLDGLPLGVRRVRGRGRAALAAVARPARDGSVRVRVGQLSGSQVVGLQHVELDEAASLPRRAADELLPGTPGRDASAR